MARRAWISRSVLLLSLSLGGWAALVTACSNQSEGERCDKASGNGGDDDCQSGLRCIAVQAQGQATQTFVCCPADTTQATTAICQAPQAVGLDAAPPATGDAATGDAALDATTPRDAGSDADAQPEDGGADGDADTDADAA